MGYLRRETGGVAVKSTRRNGAVKPLGFKPCGGTWRGSVGKRASGQPLRREKLAGIWLDRTEAEKRKMTYTLEFANSGAYKIAQLV